ncbi:hypothetical protein LCL95_13140 [Bacillus timonensis]|nr:hypothetical protein [Bacillus timonensis]
MKKITYIILMFVLLINIAIPHDVSAYSYGDPSEEKVAEAYKEMVSKLNDEPADFKSAKEVYNTVKEEIDMHMGTEPSDVILKHFEQEDKEKVIADMQKILVLNIVRRMDNIESNFEDYDTSKRLLAKAFATYNALSPVIAQNNSGLDQQMKKKFDAALEALGNPGLFGVGKKEPNKDAFIENKEFIYESLQDQFNLESLEVGHFTEGSPLEEEGIEKVEWTDLTSLKNWIPISLIVGVILGIILLTAKRRKS